MENKKLQLLNEVKSETERFLAKLKEAISEQKDDSNYSRKKYAASKRAALDLKNELTKLTQDSKYIYGS